MAARIIRGRRSLNSRLLVHDGYRYHKNVGTNNTVNMYWRCWRRDCRSRLTTLSFNINDPLANIVIQANGDNHNHPRENRQIEHADAVSQMKDAIIANPTVPIKRCTTLRL